MVVCTLWLLLLHCCHYCMTLTSSWLLLLQDYFYRMVFISIQLDKCHYIMTVTTAWLLLLYDCHNLPTFPTVQPLLLIYDGYYWITDTNVCLLVNCDCYYCIISTTEWYVRVCDCSCGINGMVGLLLQLLLLHGWYYIMAINIRWLYDCYYSMSVMQVWLEMLCECY